MSTETLKIVTVVAGLSRPSSTRLLGDRLTEAVTRELAAGDHKTEVTVVELRELAVDLANTLITGFPSPALAEALDAVTEADGLIVVTPVFAASYSGLFKSFFDVVDPDALTGKAVLLGATGGTARHSLVVEHALRPLFSYLHALTAPTGVFAATDDWATGELSVRIGRAGGEFARLLSGAARPAAEKAAAAAAAAGNAGELDEVVPFEQLLANGWSTGLDSVGDTGEVRAPHPEP
ncbi:FMN reductase [Streptomyces sp. NPDC093109]|uniref:FMN reductase n=1 Tax=Streptomyces sp. NPDC093109 TaxID=3154977 RepID=UPI00344F5662